MSFLAPLFLLGALAVAAPVVFHLIRRTSREKIPFSSLMFLRPTPPRMTRQTRLEHLLLLLLRCLVLGLLALGFSRPFLSRPTAAETGVGAGRRLVVLVDTSASLRREGLWAEARARAARILRDTRPEDSVAVVAFDRASRTVLGFEDWNTLPSGDRAGVASARLDAISPGWAGTHLGGALLNAAQLLEEQPGRGGPGAFAAKKIVVITDGQEGAHLDGLQGFDWPRGVEVAFETLAAKRPTNAGLQLLSEAGAEGASGTEPGVRVRVSNAATSRREQFQLGWVRPGGKDYAGPALDVYVPSGQSRVLAAPRPPAGLTTGSLVLRGDEEDFDNTVHLAVPAPVEVPVLFLGRDDPGDPGQLLFYVNRALQQTRRQAARVTARPASGAWTAADAADAVLLVLGETPSPEVAEGVRGKLAAGRTGLLVLRDAGMAPALAALLGVGSVTMAEATGRHALLGQIDFTHPLFAPFADPRYSDFTKINFWKHRRLETNGLPGARVAARFDDGSPALLQFPVGRGSLLVLTAGWHPADSQLALSSKFVPLLYSLLDLAGAAQGAPALVTVGDAVPLGGTNEAARLTVRRPDGTAVRPGAVASYGDTAMPGVYTLVSLAATQQFAVNLDGAESRTAPWLVETFERLGVPMKPPAPVVKRTPEQERRLRDTELEQRQKLWRWLLVGVLVLLVAETWLAGRLSARPAAA